jgi:hypothetical protein
MKHTDIVIDNYYRLKDTPNYTWVKVLRILKPKELSKEKNYYTVKCEHVIQKDDNCGFIRYFKLKDLAKPMK